MLAEKDKEQLRNLMVEYLLAVRSAYLRTAGCSVLKHWDQLQSRMRSAARTSSNPEEFATDMARSLRLESPSSDYSTALRQLTDAVHERNASREFLQLVEDEWGWICAMTRNVSDQRKEAKNV